MNLHIKLIIIISFCLVSKISFTQKETDFKVVTYNFISAQENNAKINTKLYLKEKESFHLFSDQDEKSNFNEKNRTFRINSTKENVFFYKSFKNNTITYKDYIFSQPYIIKENIPEINWKIYNEEKIIANTFVCKKAIGKFRGRLYTVWFTPQIPLSNGPWKLGGLPGLILEAYDEDREVIFNFVSFEKSKNEVDLNSFKMPKNAISWANFASIYRKKLKQFISSVRASVPGKRNVKLVKINLIEKSIFEGEK
jgi:GLPGLI family protein